MDAALSSWMNGNSTFFSPSLRELISSMRILRTVMASVPWLKKEKKYWYC